MADTSPIDELQTKGKVTVHVDEEDVQVTVWVNGVAYATRKDTAEKAAIRLLQVLA